MVQFINQKEIDAQKERRRQKRMFYGLVGVVGMAMAFGALVTWLAMADDAQQRSMAARVDEREKMIKTLRDCAATHNLYQIPGTDIIVQAKIRKPGQIEIVRVERAKDRAKRVAQ